MKWQYRSLGELFGPVEFDVLVGLAHDGTLAPDDDVKADDLHNWQRADSVVGLFDPVEYANIDDLMAPAETQADVSDLDQMLFSGASTAAPISRAGRVMREAARGTNRNDDWYCRSLGQEIGPLSFDELLAMVNNGEIAGDDSIRQGQRGQWERANEIAGLFSADAPKLVAPTVGMLAPNRTSSKPPPVAAAKKPAPLIKPAALPAEAWFYQVFGQQFGPIEMTELAAMVASGEIGDGDKVKMGKVSAWIEAKSIKHLLPKVAAAPPPPPKTESPALKSAVPTTSDPKLPLVQSKSTQKSPQLEEPDRGLDDLVDDLLQQEEEKAVAIPKPAPKAAPPAAVVSQPAAAPSPPRTAAPTETIPVIKAAPKKSQERSGPRFSFRLPKLPKGLLALISVLVIGGGAVFVAYFGNPFAPHVGLREYDETLEIWKEVEKMAKESHPASKWGSLREKNKEASARIVAKLKHGAAANRRVAQLMLNSHEVCLPNIYSQEENWKSRFQQMESNMKEAASLVAELRQ